MIIVTGGAGFIGSHLVKKLNQQGYSHILVVDNLKDGQKFKNLINCQIDDFLDKTLFLQRLQKNQYFASSITCVFHLGACSNTTEWDGYYMMDNNYEYSKILLNYCLARRIPFIYASSAAVYGSHQTFREKLVYEKPLNIYGYSKYLFDQYVRERLPIITSQVAGLRYFNVYGPHEGHKGRMASVAYHFNRQILENGEVKLFEGYDGYAAGEQRRDFIYVEDAVEATAWFMHNPDKIGIFNIGTGRSQTFNEVAKAVIDWHGYGEIIYIPFPEELKKTYQSYTQADLTTLRGVGYKGEFKDVQTGVKLYLDYLNL